MRSFRRKIVYSQSILFVVFIFFLFPLLWLISGQLIKRIYSQRVYKLVSNVEQAPDQPSLLQILKNQKDFVWQTGSLLDSSGAVIYEFPDHSENSETSSKEVFDAIKYGFGYGTHYSPLHHENVLYITKSFTAHNQNYILSVIFRIQEIDQIRRAFAIVTFFICAGLLLINNILVTLIVRYIMRPVQKIVNAIGNYKEGKEELLPRITLNKSEESGELNKLAFTFNSLIDRVQKQIEYLTKQREETEAILESIGEGIIAVDPSAKVTFVNRTACRMLGVAREVILTQSLDQIQTISEGLNKKCHELLVHALQTSGPMVQTWVVTEQTVQYLDLISAPLAHKDGALLVLQDRTSDYRIVDVGKDFIANASHELRTPITIIRGFAETLQDIPELSKTLLHEILEKIVRTCGRLDKLVRSLLTLTDAENMSEDRFKSVDLVPIVENCVHALRAAKETAKIELNIGAESAPIIADSDLLELAVMNILENAIRYSEAPAHIQATIEIMDEDVYLKIKDHGIGISEKDLPHVFDRFYTVDKARSRKSGGAGLGLSIVKTIIEKHKGKVLVISELGKGSTFTFILPLNL